jgi:hypothetical protein
LRDLFQQRNFDANIVCFKAPHKAPELDRCDRAHHAEREIGLFKRQEAGGGCMLGMGRSIKEMEFYDATELGHVRVVVRAGKRQATEFILHLVNCTRQRWLANSTCFRGLGEVKRAAQSKKIADIHESFLLDSMNDQFETRCNTV